MVVASDTEWIDWLRNKWTATDGWPVRIGHSDACPRARPMPGMAAATAGLAESAADALLDAYPTMDHLQHMPAHTFLRVGRWRDAVTVSGHPGTPCLGSTRGTSSALGYGLGHVNNPHD